MIGKTLGNFKIISQIGKGGMGEVYQAKDQKLGRDVAIKVLPYEFAGDADRVTRFQREAKVLASLNHPNIAAIHGLEEFGGTQFLVLELVEGETLADRAKRGPIPVEESLKLALQIAEAVEAAHEKGVIHRDLKPANIKVAPDGKVKVLDFGLAKGFAGEQSNLNLSNSPTLSDMATQQGVILGTAAYMSPEQARGRAVDKRSDIWAFGCVLFEMLAGRFAFEGEDISAILAAVIRAEPEWDRLPPNLHWRLREVLERCLNKELRDRYHDISDIRVDLQKVLSDIGGKSARPIKAVKPKTKLQIMRLAATTLILIIVAGALVWRLRTAEPPKVIRFNYELPEGQHFSNLENPFLAIAPDGVQFVYCTTEGLYLRKINEMGAKPVDGADKGSTDPFFSPEGQWIGYWSPTDGQLKKISVNGGAPVLITKADKPGGPIWCDDNTILYAQHLQGIMRVSANGGDPEPLIKLPGMYIAVPRILPDGKNVLFTAIDPNAGSSEVVVQSLQSRKRIKLFSGDTAQYLPTGHLIFPLENNLMAAPMDIGNLKTTGGAVPVVKSVFRLAPMQAPQYAISKSGTLIYVPGTMGAPLLNQRTFVWVDRNGNEEPLGAPPDAYFDYFRISPDGTRVALGKEVNGNQDIYIWDLVGSAMSRLTFDNSYDVVPIWTADSQRVIFDSGREGRESIYWKAADGAGNEEKLASIPERNIYPWSLSKNGKFLFFGSILGEGARNIGLLSVEGDRTPKLLLHESYNERSPMISPDGRWLAYSSDETHKYEVYVRPFPNVDGGGKWQVSTGGGEFPLWSPDGKELFYRSSDAIMAVSVETEPTFKKGTPKGLFPNKYVGQYDIDRKGKKFLMMKSVRPRDDAPETKPPRTINIVINWTEELKQVVQTK